MSPRAVLAVIGIGALAVIALWWHSTPDVRGLGGWLTGAGEVLGLLCGYGVVVLVALMARLPPLERGIGTDQLARWHAMGGRYIVSLVVAHGLLILWGYAVQAHTSLTSETATLLTQYPDVLMATVAGGTARRHDEPGRIPWSGWSPYLPSRAAPAAEPGLAGSYAQPGLMVGMVPVPAPAEAGPLPSYYGYVTGSRTVHTPPVSAS